MEQGVGFFLAHILESLLNYIHGMSNADVLWLVIGLLGQCLFMMRFIVQWIHSERHQKSLIPKQAGLLLPSQFNPVQLPIT